MLHKRSEPTHTQSVYVPQDDLTLDGQGPELFAAPVGVMRSSRGFLCDQLTQLIAVHMVWSGAGAVVVNGREHRVKSGDIFVFFPGLHIRHFDFPETPWHYTWFGLHGRRAAWALAHCGFDLKHPHRINGITSALEKHVQELVPAYREQDFPAGFPISWAWQFITLLGQEKSP
jgi:hypothetical protein